MAKFSIAKLHTCPPVWRPQLRALLIRLSSETDKPAYASHQPPIFTAFFICHNLMIL